MAGLWLTQTHLRLSLAFPLFKNNTENFIVNENIWFFKNASRDIFKVLGSMTINYLVPSFTSNGGCVIFFRREQICCPSSENATRVYILTIVNINIF